MNQSATPPVAALAAPYDNEKPECRRTGSQARWRRLELDHCVNKSNGKAIERYAPDGDGSGVDEHTYVPIADIASAHGLVIDKSSLCLEYDRHVFAGHRQDRGSRMERALRPGKAVVQIRHRSWSCLISV